MIELLPAPETLWIGAYADHDGHVLTMVVAAVHQEDAEATMRRTWAQRFGLPPDLAFAVRTTVRVHRHIGLPGETTAVWLSSTQT